MAGDHIKGWVIRLQSSFYYVQTDHGVISCKLRGRIKKGRIEEDLVAVGDWVRFTKLDDGTGVIESVDERTNELVRLDPRPRGVYRQIIVSNLDQVLFVFSCAQPEPKLRMLDRFLVIAERQGITPVIIANKVDLTGEENARKIFSVYSSLGYRVFYTSAKSRIGIEELQTLLHNRVTALAGPSGVGKSSLLNTVQPDLGLAVSKISTATLKGRHTTVVRELFQLDEGGYVIDLPGLKSLALWDIEPEELDAYFPELRKLVSECKFSDCTHMNEPDCAVLAALDQGQIHPERYESYKRLRLGDNFLD